jgi:hypothetical protein
MAGTLAVADVAFHQTHVKGDRETALASNGYVEVLW